MYPNLATFIQALESAGELVRVRAKVDPVLEISQIADLMSKSRAPNNPSASARRNDPRFWMNGGPALLFENVEGAKFPLLINAWGSYSRMEMALGVARQSASGGEPDGFEALAARIASLTKPQPPRSLSELIAKGKEFLPLLRIPPKRMSGRGACQEVVLQGEQIDLTQLPILRCWPHDGDFEAVGYTAGINDNIPGVRTDAAWNARYRGRYITLSGIHTIHADDIDDPKPASHNIGMYRVQLFGTRTMSMHWHMHHDGARHWRSWKAKGQRMPVAIVLGGESIMPYAATAPLPPGISELLLAGFLNGKGIAMVRGVTVPLWVPANAEIVIEGFVSNEAGFIGWDPRVGGPPLRGGSDAEIDRLRGREPAAPEGRATLGKGAVFEGPFGDHTGFYSMPDRYPLLEVTAITHRRNAVYPTTIVGLPPQEDYYLGKATERIFLPLLKTIVHDIEDYDLPMFGAFHNCACIKIKKAYPLQGRRVMHSIWGAGQMAWTKCVIMVDDDVDVHDTMQVMRVVGERCHPMRDVEFARGPVDILDHAAPHLGASVKMGLDATRKKGDAELHLHVEGLAAELCKTGELGSVVGEVARATERRVMQIRGVTHARIADGVNELAGWWLFIRVNKREAGDGLRVIKELGALADEVSLPIWTVVVGDDCDIANADDVFFHWLANGAFERDRVASVCGRRVAFDASAKRAGDERNGYPVRAWPPILKMSDDVVAKVEKRWAEYGIPKVNTK